MTEIANPSDTPTLNDEIPEDIEEQEAPADTLSALSSLRSALEQIAPEDAKTARVSGARATAYCTKLQEKALTYTADLDVAFHHPPHQFIKDLLPCARAYWAAQTALESIDPSAHDRRKLYKEAGLLKQRAVRALEFYAENDADTQFVLDQVRPGSGYTDRANDLQALYAALQTHRADILQRQLLSSEDVERMPKMAEKLLEPSTSEAKLNAARLLRDRAWTLLHQTYNEVMHHLRFVLRHQPAQFARLGSLFFYPTARTAPSDPTHTPTPDN